MKKKEEFIISKKKISLEINLEETQKEEEDSIFQNIEEIRPLRLGIGAKYIPFSQTNEILNKNLKKKILKNKQQEELITNSQEDDKESEEESKVTIFSKKKNKKIITK